MPPKKVASTTDSMDALYFRHYSDQIVKHGTTTAILLQVGKFYEMYDSVDVLTGMSRANVQTIAEICGSSVEPKPTSDPSRHRLFWGFPEMSLAKFERILVAAGYTVVIIVQNKDATGDVTSRTVDRISSPGTFWDSEGGLAVRKEEQLMIGIYVEPYEESIKKQPHWYLATTAFDVMTGKCISTENDLTVIDGKPVFDSVQPFWSVYPPAEVVFWWCSTAPAPSEAQVSAMFAGHSAARVPIHIRIRDPKQDGTAAANRIRLNFLESVYKHDSALSIQEYLGIGMYHFIPRALSLLLEFVKEHNPSFLTSLNSHSLWTPDDNVLLGNAALEQLAMVPTNSDKFNESMLYWLQKALTTMGKRALRERCLKPIADVEELNKRQDRIAALRDSVTRTPLEATLRGMYDLPRLYRRFQLGVGSTDDLLQMLVTYEKAVVLFKETAGQLYEVQNITALISHCELLFARWDVERIRKARIQVSDTVAVGSTHPWRRGIHADIDASEDEWNVIETEMKALKAEWESMLEESDAIQWSLKDDAPFTFTTTLRRANSLTAVAKKRGKSDILVVKRGTSTTVTLTSASLNAANTTALKLRATWKAQIDEHWRTDWSTWMDTEIAEGLLESQVNAIALIDSECALARVAEEYGYVRPNYIESTDDAPAGFRVIGLRHPIVERINTATIYIPHNLSMGAIASPVNIRGSNCTVDVAKSPGTILLYGVNAAGKSSLGKAIGLAVLMAQAGIPVPATEMTLIPYTAVFTRILGNDNLWAGMSSFVVEMTEFRSILRSAGPRTLVIGDELCAGTETASATAIVAAGLQTLTARGVHGFFATHLHELVTIPELSNNPAIVAYHLTVHPDLVTGNLIYDRKLKPGCGSAMYGLEVCRGLDMDSEFLRQAFDIRKRMFAPADAHVSIYNASVVVRACEACGKSADLETHHIVPQAAANHKGFVTTGVHKNAAGNLAVLCDECHTAHHGGLLEVQGWAATSGGRKLLVKRH